ncbi:MAG: THUMP domain-containing protein, partial [Bacteroidota bacterium]
MEFTSDKIPFVAKTLYGLEAVLAKEIENLGGRDIVSGNRAVSFTGNKELLYRLNIGLRTALSVLLPIAEFNAHDTDQLYKFSKEIDWSKYFNCSKSIVIEPVTNSKIFTHSQYAGLKVKDAIADHFRDNTGRRPDVDRMYPDIRINLHISDKKCIISLNSSGDTLNKRGYREVSDIAPVNEVLAAGMIILSGWKKNSNFIDPMCGSGTLPIEAAMYAKNIPPNAKRRKFSFMHWLDYDESLFENERKKAISGICDFDFKIIGSDSSNRAFRIAMNNLEKSGLNKNIRFFRKDFEESEDMENTIIITNPPYGQRITDDDICMLYKNLGRTLAKKFYNNQLWIISSNDKAM